VLTEELLTLPQLVHELTEAQQRTEQRLERTEQRLERLETTVQALAEAQRQTEQKIAQLIEAQLHFDRRLERVEGSLGDLKGIALEIRYYNRAFAYFSRLVRRAHALSGDELHALLAPAINQGLLSEDGADEVLQADVVVRGRQRDDGAEVYLVVEVSWGIGTGDVERAVRRASLLAQTGLQTLPVVAGERITDEAAELARAMRAWQVLDGQALPPSRG
jgi:TolA-binding protein